MVAMQVEFNSDPDALFARGEAGAEFFFEVAQHALFAQQPGLHALCTGASVTMQVRVEASIGTTISAAAIAVEIAIRVTIDNFYITIKARSRVSEV
jgi:hypothetical protein